MQVHMTQIQYLLTSFSCLFATGSFTDWSSQITLGELTSRPQGSTRLYVPSSEITSTHHMPRFLYKFWIELGSLDLHSKHFAN